MPEIPHRQQNIIAPKPFNMVTLAPEPCLNVNVCPEAFLTKYSLSALLGSIVIVYRARRRPS